MKALTMHFRLSMNKRPDALLVHLAHHIEIMKTLLIFIGLVTSCLLSGCAYDTKSGTASRPAASATTAGKVTNIYTFPVTSSGPSINYFWLDGAKLATNNAVTNTGTVRLQ
jgi:hypothetical protein